MARIAELVATIRAPAEAGRNSKSAAANTGATFDLLTTRTVACHTSNQTRTSIPWCFQTRPCVWCTEIHAESRWVCAPRCDTRVKHFIQFGDRPTERGCIVLFQLGIVARRSGPFHRLDIEASRDVSGLMTRSQVAGDLRWSQLCAPVELSDIAFSSA